MYVLVMHGLLGLSWDELGQIVTIATAFFGIGSWLNHCHNKSLERNFRQPMSRIRKTIDKLNDTTDGLRSDLHQHAEESKIAMVKLRDRTRDHESRITWLENHMPISKK